jgi:hypothetical protein
MSNIYQQPILQILCICPIFINDILTTYFTNIVNSTPCDLVNDLTNSNLCHRA